MSISKPNKLVSNGLSKRNLKVSVEKLGKRRVTCFRESEKPKMKPRDSEWKLKPLSKQLMTREVKWPMKMSMRERE